MPADLARVSFDRKRKWRGLVAQQGRVTLEADWNEAASIDHEHDRRVALEAIGRAGTPDGGYVLTPVRLTDSPPTGNLGDFTIGRGTVYVGGQRLDLDDPIAYSAQPDWLNHSTDRLWIDPTAAVPPVSTPSSTPPAPSFELVYLLASEQEVSAVEDPALADVALGGPDTMGRQRILQHVVRQPSPSGTCDGSWTAFTDALPTSGLRFDTSSMMIESATKLQVSFPEIPTAPSLCQPVATGGYLGAENQMIRVMVTGVDASSGVPSIVWGFDDASFLYRITKTAYDATAQTTTLTLASSPPDCFHFPAAGQAVEVLRAAAALTTTDYIAAPTGIVSALTTPFDNTRKTLTIAGQLPADYASTATTPQLYLRVWQAQTTVPALSTPSGPALYSVELDATGVAITLTSTTGVFHPGDYWRFALRPIKPAVVYPARIGQAPQPPDGPRTWACPLAVLTWKDGNPTVSSCVKPFVSLVELTASMGGCCTVNIGPGDVDDGATLADLLNRCANIGPVTVCLQPGTYTLSEPLAFGPELNGLTLQGCQPGVVLRGPSQPGSEFGLGLIAMQATQAVTIRGIELVAPLVAIQPPAGGFSSLRNATANQALMQAFCSGLQVAVGISANGCTDLTVEDCTFDLPDPGPTNIFGAGIYATAAIEGLAVKGCSFGSANPPATVPFNQLATIPVANNQFGAAPPYQLTFGYLQIPESTSVPQQTSSQILHDATLERSHFEGVTIPALVMARLGSLRIDTNTVRNSYGGFWLVSIAEAAQTLMFDQQNVGDTKLYSAFADVGIASLRDAIFMIASQLGQLLPTTGPGTTPATPSGVAAPTPAHLTLAREALAAIHARAQATAGVAITGLPEATRAAVGAPAALSSAIVAKAAVAVPLADTGTSVSLRLDICDCQIDAIIADSYSGAGLLVVDLTADLGSAVVHGNRIRSRFPMGESALLSGLGTATISGNIVANEVVTKLSPFITSPPHSLTSHSMVLNPAGASALLGVLDPSAPVSVGVAITGNVFRNPAILPARAPMTPAVPVPMNDWMFLNTEIDYGLVAAPAVSGVNPQGGLGSGNTLVNITGSGFTGVTAVTFGVAAAPATSIKFISDTQITAVSPAGAGTVDITVTTPAGTSGANPADRFTYLAVTGLNPASGPTGSTVQVSGSGFTGATAVQFGTTPGTGVVVAPDGTSLTVTVPAGSGQVHVTVTTPLGVSPQVTADLFTYKAKEGKETKEGKDHKDGKDVKDKDKEGLEKIRLEKLVPEKVRSLEVIQERPQFAQNPLLVDGPIAADGLAVGRAFIAEEERPAVGLNALRDGTDNPS
jgi:hypothetical protein